jgi:hypothetical protein
MTWHQPHGKIQKEYGVLKFNGHLMSMKLQTKVNSSNKDPTTLDELNEDQIKQDPFELSHDDEIPFSKLFSDLTVW